MIAAYSRLQSEARHRVIVTMNLKDFPAEVLQKYDMEAQHPDEFILRLIDLAPLRCQGSRGDTPPKP
jgi:hypothetical protein